MHRLLSYDLIEKFEPIRFSIIFCLHQNVHRFLALCMRTFSVNETISVSTLHLINTYILLHQRLKYVYRLPCKLE